MPKLLPASGHSNLQSERERFATGHAWTIGRDETLSGRQIIVFGPMLDTGATVAWTPESWLQGALQDLQALAALRPGWDSYGASAIDADTATLASEVLRVLADGNAPRPALVPTSDGGIQIEWFGAGLEFQLELEPRTEHITLFFRDLDTGAFWEGPLGEEPEPFPKLLWRVTSHG